MPLTKLTAAEQVSYLQLVLDSTTEGFYAVDTEGNTTLCNKAFLQMLGFASAKEAIGKKLHHVIHHSHIDGTEYDVNDCPIYQAASKGTKQFVPHEYFFRKDGSKFSVQYKAEPIYFEEVLQGAICTFSDITAKIEQENVTKKLREEIESANESLELGINSGAVLATWIWDVKNDKVFGDERFAKIFSMDAAKLKLGVPVSTAFKSIHPDDLDEVTKIITDVLANGTKYRAEYRIKSGSETWRWVQAHGNVERNEKGEPIRFPGILLDIDEWKQTDVALRFSEERYRTLFNSIDQGFCVIEVIFDDSEKPIDYRFLDINPTFEKQSGVSGAAGKTIKELVPNHDNHWFETYGKVAKSGEAVRLIDYAAALGKWFDVYAFKIGAANENQVAVLFDDITGRRKAEMELQESQEHLSLMVESADDFAIISANKDGVINTWNNGAERIFGYKPDDIIGKSLEVIFTEEDVKSGAADFEMTTAIESGKAYDERWHQRANGERFYASGIMAAMYDSDKKIKGFIKIARDVTEQKRAEEALFEARNAAEAANIAKTEFLANMSHEIRTPMNAIIGLSNILAMSQPLTAKQREFIKTLQTSADSMLCLINDLLDISKIEAKTVELEQIPFSITQIIQEVASMMAMRVKEKGLTFTGEGDCVDNRVFIGDPTRIRQILLNLCSNAIKFTDTGGIHVEIMCHQTENKDVENVFITVKDTGIGIPKENIDKIFQKFMQADTSINRKYGGTGLGLTITKTLAEIMGGSISVTSEVGKGSTFKVSIPLQVASNQDIAESDGSLNKVLNDAAKRMINSTILLVEDYEPNIMVARSYLESFGYKVDVATNGHEAFEKIKMNNYSAALMDVQMHGMNGLDATKLIRSYEKQNNLSPLPIIGITAHALAGDRELCLNSGMNDYMPKPFNPDLLQEKLKFLASSS